MPSAARGPNNELYEEFYHAWENSQKQNLAKLQNALSDGNTPEAYLAGLVEESRRLYEHYYDAKTRADHQNVVQMLTAAWKTPLERSAMWISGWRPTSAFHLVDALRHDSECFKSHPLSTHQLQELRRLSREAYRDEERLSYRLADLQTSLPHEPMLSSAGPALADLGGRAMKVCEDEMVKTLKVAEEIVVEADNLRMQTLNALVREFDVFQAALYFVAAAQLHLVVNLVGQKKNRGL